jgi:hypothetical protein
MFSQRECICVADVKRKCFRVAIGLRRAFASSDRRATASTRLIAVFNDFSNVASMSMPA